MIIGDFYDEYNDVLDGVVECIIGSIAGCSLPNPNDIKIEMSVFSGLQLIDNIINESIDYRHVISGNVNFYGDTSKIDELIALCNNTKYKLGFTYASI